MFAIDGVKLPSNASKRRSGTRADFERQATKLEAAARSYCRPPSRGRCPPAGAATWRRKRRKRIERLERDAAQIRDVARRASGRSSRPEGRCPAEQSHRQREREDGDRQRRDPGLHRRGGGRRAHQIIVEAQAHGTGSEQELLLPVVTAMRPLLRRDSLITADAGYHSEANLRALAALAVDALIADTDMRRRDERFATQAPHREKPDPLHDKSPESRALPLYQPSDFTYDPEARTCVCPAGKSLYRTGRALVTKGHVGEHFRGAKRDCVPCALRAQCFRTPATTAARQVAFFRGKTPLAAPTRRTRRG